MGTATPGSSDTFTVSVRTLVLREANAEGSYPVLQQDLNQHIRCEQERSTAQGDRAQAPIVLVTNSNTACAGALPVWSPHRTSSGLRTPLPPRCSTCV